MLRLTISEQGRDPKLLSFPRNTLTIGRLAGNDLVLANASVSKHHSRLTFQDRALVIVDLGSTNGTLVNGARIEGPQAIDSADEIQIGDFSIRVDTGEALVSGGPTADAAVEIAPEKTSALQAELRRKIHQQVILRLDLRRLDIDRLGDQELRRRTEQAIRSLLEEMQSRGDVPEHVDRGALVRDVLDEALGLGPLEPLLADPEVTEIMVNQAERIYVERKGRLALSGRTFSSNQAVLGAIERIVTPIGRRIDEASPLVDARLKDGSRVNAIIPPLALEGPCLTIRKFKRDALRMDDLIRHRTLSGRMADFLKVCVCARKNIVISGGTGSGKTTTLNVVSSFVPSEERIITIEDAAELQLPQDHWVRLESRPPNLEGRGGITIRDLVKNCLRMRPDRIIVGECRSGEALDMLQAMNTGHDGSITTLHANTPRDALARLETLVLMAGMDLPVKAIREQIASAVHIIVQQSRFPDGSRKICFITELAGMEGDVVSTQDLFAFEQEGFEADGRVRGRFVATGFVPRFYEELRKRGLPVDLSLFREG